MSLRPSAFTIVELIVVITVVALILAIAIPGLSAIATESHFNSATQSVNGALTRAYYAALEDVNMTAVRFLPGEWNYDETAEAQRPPGRQHVLTYSYVATTAADPSDVTKVRFGEYFQRREGGATLQLPDDVWIAPLESLETGTRKIGTRTYTNFGEDFVLNGDRGQFRLDADPTVSGDFLQADDFLITFDPQTGVCVGKPAPRRVKAYVPEDCTEAGGAAGSETDRNQSGNTFYQRYNFSGIVIYRRGPFVSLGDGSEAAADRQDWLRANGRPYLLHRFGGGLVMGTQGSE